MSFDIVKGKLYENFLKNDNLYNELEVKVLKNIKKVAMTVSKVKYYLSDHFLNQVKTQNSLILNGFTKETWYLSTLETGFYQLATNLLNSVFSEKKDKQISIDFLLGLLIENANMKKIPNILSQGNKLNNLNNLRDEFLDEKTKKYLSALKKMRDGNTAHHDISFSNPEILTIKEVYELFYKMNNTLANIFDCLELQSDVIIRINDKQFLSEINSYLNENGIFE